MLMPSSLALLLAAVPAARRAVAVSTWSAVAAMAAALGPPVGGFLVELSWRWIFFVNVPVGLLALVAGLLVLAKTPGTGSGIPDLFGALSLIAGVGALVWALIELPVTGSARDRRCCWPSSVPVVQWPWRCGVRCVIHRLPWTWPRYGCCRCGRVALHC